MTTAKVNETLESKRTRTTEVIKDVITEKISRNTMGDSREEIPREFLPRERMMVKVDSKSNVGEKKPDAELQLLLQKEY